MADRPYDYLSALGARIAIARNEMGMSQAKLAESLGISLRAYQGAGRPRAGRVPG